MLCQDSKLCNEALSHATQIPHQWQQLQLAQHHRRVRVMRPVVAPHTHVTILFSLQVHWSKAEKFGHAEEQPRRHQGTLRAAGRPSTRVIPPPGALRSVPGHSVMRCPESAAGAAALQPVPRSTQFEFCLAYAVW
jgi:hypothetical protein